MCAGRTAIVDVVRVTSVEVRIARDKGRLGIPENALVGIGVEPEVIRVLSQTVQVWIWRKRGT